MKNVVTIAVTKYLRDTLLQIRGNHITQEQMAANLHMSTRNYQELESGKRNFSLVTFCMFILYACPDRHAFFDGLLQILDNIASAQGQNIAT